MVQMHHITEMLWKFLPKATLLSLAMLYLPFGTEKNLMGEQLRGNDWKFSVLSVTASLPVLWVLLFIQKTQLMVSHRSAKPHLVLAKVS